VRSAQARAGNYPHRFQIPEVLVTSNSAGPESRDAADRVDQYRDGGSGGNFQVASE
jgi:hypothetical protein